MKKKSRFVLGALVGAGLGMLFAPKKGSETRKELFERTKSLLNQVKELDVEDIKEQLSLKLEEIEMGIKDLDKEKVLKVAKEKGEDLKEKALELFEIAKDAGKPVLEDAAKAVKTAIADVTKEVLNKLEQEEKK